MAAGGAEGADLMIAQGAGKFLDMFQMVGTECHQDELARHKGSFTPVEAKSYMKSHGLVHSRSSENDCIFSREANLDLVDCWLRTSQGVFNGACNSKTKCESKDNNTSLG